MVNKKFWKNWTISTRIGAVISFGVITSIIVIVMGTATFLKKEYLATFGKQQFTTLQAFAASLDADLTGKLKALTDVAAIVPPKVLLNPASTQQFLANRTGIFTLFDDGLMILSAEGRLLAEMPFISEERLNTDYSAAPFFQLACKAARPIISDPFYSVKPDKQPIIEMMTPIHDEQGAIAGYLCGGLSLTGDNPMGNIARRKMGDMGYFYLFDQDRTILTHHDPSRTMKRDVPPGANSLFDQALQGFDGSGEIINSRGLYCMASFQHLQAAPWILAVNLPMQEVLTPFYTSQRMIIVIIFISGLWMLLVSWWSLLRFMAPLERFIHHMKKCGHTPAPFRQEEGGPELSLLATIFNQMLAKMKDTQAELATNEELQRTLLNASPDLIFLKDGQDRWLLANDAALSLFQLNRVNYQGKTGSELSAYSPNFREALLYCEQTDQLTWEQHATLSNEEIMLTPDGEKKVFEVTKTPLYHPDGSPKTIVVISRNITLRKTNEDKLRVLSKAVEQSPVSIVITDILGNIEFVNPRFTRLTGYTLDEARGQNPRILKTDRTPPETFTELWQTITAGRIWEGDFYNKKKNGEEFTEHAIISPIFDDKGEITHYMAIKEDITIKKLSEEIIWRQANFDHLTDLPNRRLFLYRLENSIPYTARDNRSLVLLFLDLDHFKEVNDTLGHDYGDMLLVEAARRLVECVRDTDTVSRFGGDEFVLLLTRIKLEVGIDKVTKKILAALSRPFQLDDTEVTISASIGVTICPQDGSDISTLLKNADRAMYLAKNAGRNCWRSFTDLQDTEQQG